MLQTDCDAGWTSTQVVVLVYQKLVFEYSVQELLIRPPQRDELIFQLVFLLFTHYGIVYLPLQRLVDSRVRSDFVDFFLFVYLVDAPFDHRVVRLTQSEKYVLFL